MSQLVFGPRPTGLTIFGMHIPLVSTSVYLGDGGTVPGDLQIVGTGPTGQTGTCKVVNGTTMTIGGIGNVSVEYLINDCQTLPASGQAPERYQFKVTLRATGTVSVHLIPIPINVQIDAFDVTVATNVKTHLKLMNAVPGAIPAASTN